MQDSLQSNVTQSPLLSGFVSLTHTHTYTHTHTRVHILHCLALGKVCHLLDCQSFHLLI